MAFVFKPNAPRPRPPVAALSARWFAGVLDGLILGVPMRILIGVADIAFNSAWAVAALFAAWTLGDALLQVIWLSSTGQSPGRAAMKIRVVDAKTYRIISFGQALRRELCGSLLHSTVVGGLISALTAAMRDDRRALHDRFAGTFVASTNPADSTLTEAAPLFRGRRV